MSSSGEEVSDLPQIVVALVINKEKARKTTHTYTHTHTHTMSSRHTHTQAGWQTDTGLTFFFLDNYIHTMSCSQKGIMPTNTHTHTHTQCLIDRKANLQTSWDRQTGQQADRQTHTDTDRLIDRQTKRETGWLLDSYVVIIIIMHVSLLFYYFYNVSIICLWIYHVFIMFWGKKCIKTMYHPVIFRIGKCLSFSDFVYAYHLQVNFLRFIKK